MLVPQSDTSSFHSRLEPNKFRSPSVKAGHNCTKLAPAEQNLRLPEMRNKTPQSFRHIPNVSSRSQQPQELYSLSIPHPRGLMRTETQLAGSKQIHGNSCQKNGNPERKYATDMQIHLTLRDEVNGATFRLSLPSVSAETAGISENHRHKRNNNNIPKSASNHGFEISHPLLDDDRLAYFLAHVTQISCTLTLEKRPMQLL